MKRLLQFTNLSLVIFPITLWLTIDVLCMYAVRYKYHNILNVTSVEEIVQIQYALGTKRPLYRDQ